MSYTPMKRVFFPTVIFLLCVYPAGAEVIPYSNDFSGTGANTAFTAETTDAEWTVTSGVYQYSTNNTSYTASTASFPVTNAAGVNFTMQTLFTVSSAGIVNANGATIGFGLFGSSPAFTGTDTSNSYYLADFQYGNSGTPGTLRIIALGNTSGTTGTSTIVDANPGTANLAVVVGTTYLLKLVGTYSGTTLNMSLGLFDSGGGQIGSSATATDTSVLTGTNFGFRNRIGLSGGTATVNFDDFNITPAAVPEPGTTALMIGGVCLAAALAARRGLRRNA